MGRPTFLSDRRGNFGAMTALFLPVALSLMAIAVDQGSLYFERRETQALADLAAIAGAAASSDPAAAVLATLSANGLHATLVRDLPNGAAGGNASPSARVMVEPGHYTADPALAASSRFVAGAAPVNAVRVRLARPGTRHFAETILPPVTIAASGLAHRAAEARFSVGSRLLGLDGGILNAVLGELLGAELSLSVMDYRALAAADIDLPVLLDAVGDRLSVTAVTYDRILAAGLTAPQLAGALATRPELSAAARGALALVSHAVATPTAASVTLGEVLDLSAATARGAALASRVNVLDLLSAAAVVAGGGRQVALDLGAALPGLLAVRATLAIGEPPQASFWTTVGGQGSTVRTAQTRLRVEIEIGGPSGLLGSRIHLPLHVEVASAQARLSEIACPGGRVSAARVTIATRPGIATAAIGTTSSAGFADFSRPASVSTATLLAVPLVSVRGRALVDVASPAETPLVFEAADIESHAVKSTSTTGIVGSLTSSLLGNLRLEVNVAGLGLGLPSNLTGTVATLLEAAAPAADAVIGNVLLALGIRLGEADVRVGGVSCGRPVLVQ